VGGAKLAEGLYRALPPEDLTIVVNTGDDFEHLGLTICPDLDTVCYTLAGLANPETGWGRAGESWQALESLAALGGPDWFRLGDKDLGTHLERSRRLAAGEPLTAVTRDFCAAWDIGCTVLPMSDQPVRTIVDSEEGELSFQDYFVRRRCEPVVRGFRFQGAEAAQPSPGLLEAVSVADMVLLCPSNPWVSIAPILALPGLRDALTEKIVIAVSPIVGGAALKGPAAKMYQELGIEPSALAVAEHYRDLLRGLVIDNADAGQAEPIAALGIMPLVTDSIMQDGAGRLRLAREVLEFGQALLEN
jgi:LPPG:FO 2-phospho-L-lactate transferase